MIETNQVYLLIVKVIELALYSYAVYALNKKYKGVKFSERPSLHRFFITGLSGWIVYMFFDSIIYVIAPLSIPSSASVDAVYSGYLTEYPSLFYANILRDFAIPGALFMAWNYCAAAVQISRGINLNEDFLFSEDLVFPSHYKIKIQKRKIYPVLALIFIALIVYLDQIEVHVIDPGKVHVTSKWGIVNSLSLVLFFTFATILMVQQLNFLRTRPMEEDYKRRARFLGWGIISFTSGLYYWGITGVIFSGIEASNTLILIFLFLGHAIWSSSAVLISLAFRQKEKALESQES
ncbi:MAG: hypothetical protein K9W44_14455 [Candidatus Lokiarchaeota archaeon]|nr:hypothetical protein [Candidatus Harpocratesius repetitus]